MPSALRIPDPQRPGAFVAASAGGSATNTACPSCCGGGCANVFAATPCKYPDGHDCPTAPRPGVYICTDVVCPGGGDNPESIAGKTVLIAGVCYFVVPFPIPAATLPKGTVIVDRVDACVPNCEDERCARPGGYARAVPCDPDYSGRTLYFCRAAAAFCHSFDPGLSGGGCFTVDPAFPDVGFVPDPIDIIRPPNRPQTCCECGCRTQSIQENPCDQDSPIRNCCCFEPGTMTVSVEGTQVITDNDPSLPSVLTRTWFGSASPNQQLVVTVRDRRVYQPGSPFPDTDDTYELVADATVECSSAAIFLPTTPPNIVCPGPGVLFAENTQTCTTRRTRSEQYRDPANPGYGTIYIDASSTVTGTIAARCRSGCGGPSTTVRAGDCPTCGEAPIVRWLGLDWYGVPMPLREAGKTYPGCGCVKVLRDIWDRLTG